MPKDKADETPAVDPANLPPPHKSHHAEHGAQVVLSGDARAAARGALAGDIVGNTIARDAAVGRGEAADGTTPDGSTPDGRLPPDVKDGADQPAYGAPGQGEGKPGARPGDDKVAAAEAEAEQARVKAKADADKKAASDNKPAA